MERLSDELEVRVPDRPVRGFVRPPGSKSLTNRALPIAALAHGRSVLTGVLDSEDTRVMAESLRRLGIAIEHRTDEGIAVVDGCSGSIQATSAELFLANSGTSIRFLAALVSLAHGRFVLDGVERMRERPIGDLLVALNALGVDALALNQNGCPPIAISANGLRGGEIAVRGDTSSQFLSALLIAAPLASGPTQIVVEGPLVSQPYVDMTLAVMRAFGVECGREDYRQFDFAGMQTYRAADYAIEPDASAASYFFAAAAITGGEVTVDGLGSSSLQGDLAFVRLLERMGCTVAQSTTRTRVTGAPLMGIDADMRDISDTVPTLAAAACFANSPTRIFNVEHVRVKETDRLNAVATELRKAGVRVEESRDGLVIHPGPLHDATFDTYKDHRMAMSLALLGLRIPGVIIRDPGCTAKTYPGYFADLARITSH